MQGQRSADFVTDVLEEPGPGPVEVGQRRGPVPLGLVGQRVGDRDGDLVGDQLEEGPVVGVELTVRADPQHDRADPPGLAVLGQRQDQRRVRLDVAGGAGGVEARRGTASACR